MTPHCSHDASPFTICTGCLLDLSYICTSGYRGVYVLPPCATCLDTRTGVSLAMQDVLYYDLNSPQVRNTSHLVLTDFDNKTPNAQLLRSDTILPKEALDLTSKLQHLDISSSPFTTMVNFEVCYDSNDPIRFGFHQITCIHLHRAYVTDFT